MEMETVASTTQDSESIYWLAFERSALCVALVGLDGRLSRLTPEFCRFLGYAEGELKATRLQHVTHPDDQAAIYEAERKLLGRFVTTCKLEARFVRKDGKVVWGALSLSPVNGPGRHVMYFMVGVQDVTGYKSVQERATRLLARFHTVCDGISDLVSIHDLKGTYLFANHACANLLGYAPGELVGTSVYDLCHPDDLRKITRTYHKYIAGWDHPTHGVYRMRRKDGDHRWFQVSIRPVTGTHGMQRELVWVCREGGEEPGASRALPAPPPRERRQPDEPGRMGETSAMRDELTGLSSRQAIDKILSEKLRSRRASTFPVGCLLVDIDHFATINTRYGRLVGDEALRRVAALLAASCREWDFAGRYDGDEFVVVLPDTDAAGTIVVGERLLRAVREAGWNDYSLAAGITVSIGGTCIVRRSNMTLAELMSVLHSQLRQAKEAGRNCMIMNARSSIE